jgi:hypothetical protein
LDYYPTREASATLGLTVLFSAARLLAVEISPLDQRGVVFGEKKAVGIGFNPVMFLQLSRAEHDKKMACGPNQDLPSKASRSSFGRLSGSPI